MSGPQGYDPTQPWQPQPPGQGEEQQSPERYSEQQWQQPANPEQSSPWQPPAYTQPTAPYPSAPPYPSAASRYPQPEQYGQPTQYGQYPQQPGQYGRPGQGDKRSTVVIGTVVAAFLGIIAVVVLVLGFWKPGFFVTTRLDVDKAQAGVQQILTDQTNGYGAKNVKDVKCNNGQSPVVKQGDTFNCEVSIDGTKRQVTVTFRDNSGTYEVGRPK